MNPFKKKKRVDVMNNAIINVHQIIPPPSSFPSFKNQLDRSINRLLDKPLAFLFFGAIATFLIYGFKIFILSAPTDNHLSVSDLSFRIIAGLVYLFVISFPLVAISLGATYKINGRQAIKHTIKKIKLFYTTFFLGFLTNLLPTLLILPGIIMSFRFSLIPSIVITENKTGFEALGRSWGLATNHTRFIFRNFLLIAIITTIPIVVISFITGLNSWAIYIPLAITIPLFFTIQQITYEDLNRIKKNIIPGSNEIGIYKKMSTLGAIAFCLFLTGYGIVHPENLSTADSDKPVQTSEAPQETVTGKNIAQSAKDRDWTRYQDVSNIRVATNKFFNDHGKYPDNIRDLVPTYLKSIPVDPVTGFEYQYQKSADSYEIGFSLEQGVSKLGAGGHTLTQLGFNIKKTEPKPELAFEDSTGSPDIQPARATQTHQPPVNNNQSNQTETTNNPNNKVTKPTPINSQPIDSDGDGLSDDEEDIFGTDPYNPDTDEDGVIDGDEIYLFETNPLLADSDGDSFDDTEEIINGSNPNDSNDNIQAEHNLPNDSDNDGLNDGYELLIGTDPFNPDTDDDGLADGDEINIYETNPLSADTDLDGIPDGEEIINGTNPNIPETNNEDIPPDYIYGGGGGSGTSYQQQVEVRIKLFGLHEPSLSTLGVWHPAWPGL